MPNIMPYPTATKDDYWPLTAAILGMINPMMMQKPPITPKQGEIESILSAAQSLSKIFNKPIPKYGPEDLILKMAQDRLRNAALTGRMGDVNEILQALVQESTPLAKQLMPQSISTLLGGK